MYERSTQARFWTFSEKRLKEIREETNRLAIEVIKAVKEDEKTLVKSAAGKPTDLPFLTSKEEILLCRYYEKKLSDLCGFLAVSNRVRATAVLLYKRFFVKCSVMDYHPYQISFTALFLATKVEEERMSVEIFTEKTRTPTAKLEPAQVLAHEVTMLEKLDFHLSVFNPYLPLYGFYLDMTKFFSSSKQPKVQPIYEAYKEAINAVHETLVTDLCFLYHPAQLALGALYRGCKEKDLDLEFESYLKGKHEDPKAFDDVMHSVNHIHSVLDESKIPSDAVQKKLVERLAQCRNPATNPNTEYYKLKQQEREKQEAEAKKRKPEKKAFVDELESIQGPPEKKRVAEDEELVLSTRGTHMNLSPRYQKK